MDGTLIETDDANVNRWAQRLSRVIRSPEKAETLARRLVMAAESPGNAAFTLLDLVGLDTPLLRLLITGRPHFARQLLGCSARQAHNLEPFAGEAGQHLGRARGRRQVRRRMPGHAFRRRRGRCEGPRGHQPTPETRWLHEGSHRESGIGGGIHKAKRKASLPLRTGHGFPIFQKISFSEKKVPRTPAGLLGCDPRVPAPGIATRLRKSFTLPQEIRSPLRFRGK